MNPSHPSPGRMNLFRTSSAASLLMAYLLNGALHPFYSDLGSPFDVILGLLFLQVSFLLATLLPALFIFERSHLITVFRLRKLSKTSCIKITGLAFIAFPLILLSAIISNMLVQKLGIPFVDKLGDFLKTQKEPSMGILIFTSVFAAPLIEEIAFRLCLFEFLGRFFKTSKIILPTIISSLIFSALHGDPVRMLGLFVLGSILQFIMIKYKTLLAPILFHTVHNILAFSAFFAFS
jgi:membrane protease YdiL (CAAX protease family)